jgi:hypothetical protein
MKEPILSASQLRMLAEGLNNGGRLQAEFAERLYSSDEAARSALMSLESWGFIVADRSTCGCFLVVKAPDEAFIMADRMKEAKKKLEKVLAGSKIERSLDD